MNLACGRYDEILGVLGDLDPARRRRCLPVPRLRPAPVVVALLLDPVLRLVMGHAFNNDPIMPSAIRARETPPQQQPQQQTCSSPCA